ncbi:MAG: phenylalanine--tRNA ligase subunit beta [Candidatus Parcubacteria bacterium]|nr:phenylalanine--tRNA ligase subunit beta [Candidatus Parcubacteria bacterium]
MKVSLKWLQTYFDTPLPPVEKLADALTFHAFEIEETTAEMLDVKVLPNRAADCLCHRGIAKELSAILNLPLTSDPLRTDVGTYDVPTLLRVEIEDPKKCLRYMGAVVKGVKVGPSPAWLKEAIEAVGQRSINNIVDATNYVMLNIGQPLHAFDAGKLAQKDGKYSITVRDAKEEEKITTLSGEEFILSPNIQLITDANADTPIALAGIKGGKSAEVTADTADLIIESANFDGTTTRRAAQALKLFTDASVRFQNRPSPELCAYGMRDVLALIQEVAGGEIIGVVDGYPNRAGQNSEVSISLAKINDVLGSSFSKEEVENVFKRLALPYMVVNDTFTITPPFERTDLAIPEDLVEEVGRIIGYDRIPATELPPLNGSSDQARYRGIEHIKDFLVERGFTEISTQSFAKEGDSILANPLDKNMPALRTSLDENMKMALERAKYVAPLVLPPNEKPKLFEIGNVFTKDGEQLSIKTSEPVPGLPEIKDDANYEPKRYVLGAYQPFSVYPFITRDISVWTPNPVAQESNDTIVVLMPIVKKYAPAPEFFTPVLKFDFYKDPNSGRTSEAFQIVFQSDERTLTDEEVNGIMVRVSGALTKEGFEVR